MTNGAHSPGPRRPPPRPSLLPSVADLQRLQAQREAPVEAWLAGHEADLASTSVTSLVARIRTELGDQMPALSDDDVAAVVRRYATAHGISLPDPLPATPSGGGGVSLGAAAARIASSLPSIPTEIGFDQAHGWALVGFGGPTVGLRSGRFKVGSSIGWDGALGLESSLGDYRFRASLTAERWELRLGFRIGPAMPDLSSLSSIFVPAGEALTRVAAVTATLPDPAEAARAIGDEVKPIRRAITTAGQIGRARPGASFQLDPVLFGRGPAGPADQPPIGFGVTARFTVVF